MNRLFEDMMDLDYFFLSLQGIYKVKLFERQSVIVFDEVQNQPLARQAIKHLVKIQNIVIPSEEMKMTLHPMDLEEFYWAIGNDVTPDQQRQMYDMKRAAGNAVHRLWMRDLRLYMLVGGMPQAVDNSQATHRAI